MENQEEIWDNLAVPWKSSRMRPIEAATEFLKDKTGRILDLGCGSGRNFSVINGKVYGVDFSGKMLELAKKFVDENKIEAELIKADATNLPFGDNFFDASIFVAALHCIVTKEKREKSLKELLRILKPGAEAFIAVWDYDQEKFKSKEKESFISWTVGDKKYMRYYYLYDRDEFINLLEKTGFEIIKIMSGKSTSGFHSKKNIVVIVRKP